MKPLLTVFNYYIILFGLTFFFLESGNAQKLEDFDAPNKIKTSNLSFNSENQASKMRRPLHDFLNSKLKNSDQIKLDLFVMSQCPYGVNAEKEIISFLKKNDKKISFQLYFIAVSDLNGKLTSLHGDAELQEDFRQIIISKLYPELLYDYVLERAENYMENDWKSVAQKLGINSNKIEDIIQTEEGKKLISENIKYGNGLQINSSPSVFINGEKYSGPILPMPESGVPLQNLSQTLLQACANNRTTTCDNGDPCTIKECVRGTCIFTHFDCNAPNACTTASCSNSQCNLTPINTTTPTGVSVSSTSITFGSSVTLSASCASQTVTWYNQSSGGTALGTGASLDQSPTSDTTYYASCSNGTCESSRIATSQVKVNAVVPLELISFEAQIQNANVFLTWQTANEENIDYFEIERSLDGKEFIALLSPSGLINKINASNGKLQSYQFFDKNPVLGISYYRLKTVEKNGVVKYSLIKSVEFNSGKDDFALFPNPAKDILNVRIIGAIPANIRDYTINNTFGQILLKGTLDNSNNPVDISQMPSGVFFMKIGNEIRKFVKN